MLFVISLLMAIIIQDAISHAPPELVGGKAKGLLRLKVLERRLNEELYQAEVTVPPFFVVPPEADLVRDQEEIRNASVQLGSTYAVRSSSCLEDVGENSFDGIFETQLDVPKNRLVQAISEVRKSAVCERARMYARRVGTRLDGRMPVIVQAMVDEKDTTGVVFSRFPCPKDIAKVVQDDVASHERHIDVFLRGIRNDGTHYASHTRPLIVSRKSFTYWWRAAYLANMAIKLEDDLGYPIIMEFASQAPRASSQKFSINLLQARKLTNLSGTERLTMPELYEPGLIATTNDISGTGDFTGEAFVVGMVGLGTKLEEVRAHGVREFDAARVNGYVLVTPFMQFFRTNLDRVTPHKKAVVAYYDLGQHHDMEIARKSDLLYLNCKDCLSHAFYEAQRYRRPPPILTHDRIRVVSDGLKGFVFNLSY